MTDQRVSARSKYRFSSVAAVALAAATLAPPPALALEREKTGWYHTGDAVMTTSVVMVSVDVFAVRHDMKCLPDHRSEADVVSAECDKRFTWRALRDVGRKKIHESLREAYEAVDYQDQANIRLAVSAFTGDLKEGARAVISYDEVRHVTSFWSDGGARVEVPGAAFMKATWSIMLVNPEMREVGHALVSRLEP